VEVQATLNPQSGRMVSKVGASEEAGHLLKSCVSTLEVSQHLESEPSRTTRRIIPTPCTLNLRPDGWDSYPNPQTLNPKPKRERVLY